jgi:hypothetical protein
MVSDTGSVPTSGQVVGRGEGAPTELSPTERAILNRRHPVSLKCFSMCNWDHVLFAIDGRKYELRMIYLRNNYVKMTKHCLCTRSEGI